MRKNIEAHERSKELAARAAAVGSGGGSSDDPEAVKKLRAQLAKHERKQEQVRSGAGRPACMEAIAAAISKLSDFSQQLRDRLEKIPGQLGQHVETHRVGTTYIPDPA